MRKFFNIAGPCNAADHYMVPLLERNKEILPLIEQKQYFVIHAARQSGKTTLLQELVDHYTQAGEYYALYCSLEQAQVFTEAKEGIPQILNTLRFAVKYSQLPHRDTFAQQLDIDDTANLIKNAITDYCLELDKPLVIFFDE
ncbi:MAG: hypothetical protein J5I98_14785, partial [Phaeodactylibacter sp.]|nr:hypothetical protein [Phaeodactylibacter sp.]